MVDMNAPQLRFFGGLLWYLEMRNWALDKVRTCPHGSNAFDIRMPHDLYFSYLFGAVDLVGDYLRDDPAAQRAFNDQVTTGLGDANSNGYARQLRNEIVHRGLDSSAAGDSDNTTLYVLCPPTVTDQSRKKTYTRPFTYTVELATHCNAAVNLAISEALERLNLFNPEQHMVSETDTVAAILSSPEQRNRPSVPTRRHRRVRPHADHMPASEIRWVICLTDFRRGQTAAALGGAGIEHSCRRDIAIRKLRRGRARDTVGSDNALLQYSSHWSAQEWRLGRKQEEGRTNNPSI
jgi:hypothetical protein